MLRQQSVLKRVLVLLSLALLAALVSIRHHVRDLAEVARTYSTFYPYLEHHPETLLRYSNSISEHHSAATSNDSALAPRIIHQIFLTEGRPTSRLSKYATAIISCQSLHPDWTHNLWVDESATAFIAQHYPAILPHYRGYTQRIQRANILRYALLEHFGGVYLDLDISCLEPLDELRGLPFVTPGAHPAGVNNAFILAQPGHRFLRHLLDGVESRDLKWGLPYVENMLSTGCMFFSNRWMSYVRSLSAKSSSELLESDRVHILADEEGDIAPHMLRGKITTPLFEHGGASSWHGWDAAAIVMVGKYYRLFLIGIGIGLGISIFMIWRYLRSRAASMRGRQTLLRRSMDKTVDREALVGSKEGYEE